MANNHTKDKLTKSERLSVLKQVDDIFTNYCHVCPYFGHNTPHQNCGRCPIEGQLQEHGRQLGWESLQKNILSNPWTEKEDKFLLLNRPIMTMKQIAERLRRTESSVNNRYTKIKRRE